MLESNHTVCVNGVTIGEHELHITTWHYIGKRSSDNFLNVIANYDIVCLSETWTNKSSLIDLKGYSSPIHSYRKYQHKRARRSSGGLIIYIKDSIRAGIELIKMILIAKYG